MRNQQQAVKYVDTIIGRVQTLDLDETAQLMMLNGYLSAAHDYKDIYTASILQTVVLDFAESIGDCYIVKQSAL